jgi:hypothetical protein
MTVQEPAACSIWSIPAHLYSSLPLKLHMLKPFSIWCMLVTLLAT